MQVVDVYIHIYILYTVYQIRIWYIHIGIAKRVRVVKMEFSRRRPLSGNSDVKCTQTGSKTEKHVGGL